MEPLIIDRRKNTGKKNLTNRERFIERSKHTVREAVNRVLPNKSLSDTGDTKINISSDGIREPQFIYDNSVGEFDYVLPGNEEYLEGDLIRKRKSDFSGGGGAGSGSGDGVEDTFSFSLSYEEFLNIVFEGLELPDLVKKTEKHAVAFTKQRAAYTKTGVPSNLNIERSMIASIGRRMVMRKPKQDELKDLEEELADTPKDSDLYLFLKEQIEELKKKIAAVPFIDDVDLKYNNYIKVPKPMTQAVMFCILDVSYSMGENEKLIAKKFFLLLNLFLKRRYERVDVVFVRHHDRAMECDEGTFFTLRETGGTVVSTAYKLISDIIKERYSSDNWNIYISQASDGDNNPGDDSICKQILSEELLPITQYFTYLEIENDYKATAAGMFFYTPPESSLLTMMKRLQKKHPNLSLATIGNEDRVIPVFRELFTRKDPDNE